LKTKEETIKTLTKQMQKLQTDKDEYKRDCA